MLGFPCGREKPQPFHQLKQVFTQLVPFHLPKLTVPWRAPSGGGRPLKRRRKWLEISHRSDADGARAPGAPQRRRGGQRPKGCRRVSPSSQGFCQGRTWLPGSRPQQTRAGFRKAGVASAPRCTKSSLAATGRTNSSVNASPRQGQKSTLMGFKCLVAPSLKNTHAQKTATSQASGRGWAWI